MKYSCLLLFLLLPLLNSCKPKTGAKIHDNFEGDTLNAIWTNDKFLPGAFKIQSHFVRSGKSAAILTLQKGDQIKEEKGTELERAELKESKKLMAFENKVYVYSFSILLPKGFPISPERLVIAQWKQNCKSGNCNPDNPILALRYNSGIFRITLQVGPDKITLFRRTDSIINNWMDFKFKIKFSRNPDGRIKTWLNGKEIIDYSGVTAYSETYGYPLPGNFYFKIGLYRDQMPQTMNIYIDDYEKQELEKW